MHKVIKLQSIELTNKKFSELELARNDAKYIVKNIILPKIDDCKDNGELQQKTYNKIRKNSSLPSQVILNLIRSSFHLKKKPIDKRYVDRITLDYNIPRVCKFYLESGTLCFSITTKPRQKLVIPIKMNDCVKRLNKHIDNGWKIKQISITFDNNILVNISKKKISKPWKNILGVDINSNNVSLTVLSPKGKILKQLYLGKNLWNRKQKILLRKYKLQSLADKGSCKAKYRLKQLKKRVKNITKNAVGEIAKEIHEIAERYNAKIVFERLHKFTVNMNKKANRIISLIPWKMLQMQCAVRSVDTGIPLGYVNPYHTSKWCPRCGSVNPGHSNNYAIYKCKKCGFVCNSDRKSSLAIAVKKYVERKYKSISNNKNVFFQFSTYRVQINALFRVNEAKAEPKVT